jgi:hypothetical protein
MKKSRRIIQAWHAAGMPKLKMGIQFLLENLKRRDHSEDLGVKERIILERELEGVDWIRLAQDRDRWRLLRSR